MAVHFPPINQPLEGVPHPKKVEDLLRKHTDELANIRAMLAKMRRDGATNSQQVVNINNRVRRITPGMGVPPGGMDGDRLGKLSDDTGDFDWVRNTLGGMKLKTFEPDETSDINLIPEWEAQILDLQIASPADNTVVTIGFPDGWDFTRDIALPFYLLSIYVYDFSVDLEISGKAPYYYDHPTVAIMGVDDSGVPGTVTLPAGFVGQWFVIPNYLNNEGVDTPPSVAIPLFDEFYSGRFGPALNAGPTPPTVVATAAAGTSPTVTVNGTSTSGVVELATGTSPTTTGWGELLTFTGGWASGDVPVLALYPANQAAAALNHYGTRAGTEAEAHFDLTGIAASTTYKFHYSLLPYTAV